MSNPAPSFLKQIATDNGAAVYIGPGGLLWKDDGAGVLRRVVPSGSGFTFHADTAACPFVPGTPGPHTHPTSEVAGLDSALGAKAAASHSHAPSEVTGTAIIEGDARLSDARAPTAHGHASGEIGGLGTAATKNVGTGAGTVAAGDDSRLANARPPTSLLSTGTTGPTAVGYLAGSGVGGSVTQLTSKSTGVTLSKLTGKITTHSASLAAGGVVSFIVTNTLVASVDTIAWSFVSGATAGAYCITIAVSAGAFSVTIRNLTGGALSEAIVFQFNVVKGSAT